MVFSSLIFLFAFLPVTLASYVVAARQHRNFVLLLASLLFYAWGEAGFVALMIASALVNYYFGLAIENQRAPGRRILLLAAVAINLLPLVFFKYTVFMFEALRVVPGFSALPDLTSSNIHLPIGISFFTFQAISYLVDVHRSTVAAQRKFLDLALYIALFPQLIAGPIVRYNEIASQLSSRHSGWLDIQEGSRRFLTGLIKKVLIANTMGQVADHVFGLPVESVNAGLAWIGVLAYSLQIYFDFSGYSDMAIGLGRLFGFRFPENFYYPYVARSITDFWRRWHISLSRWFRDYVYIPLGGNRKGHLRTSLNLVLVFVLCGLWHGAAWTFLVWGLLHGFFLVIERLGLGRVLARLPVVLQHAYTLLLVLLAWVFFRAENLPHALGYLQAMFDFSRPSFLDVYLVTYQNLEFWLMLLAGLVFSTPIGLKLMPPYEASTAIASGAGSVIDGSGRIVRLLTRDHIRELFTVSALLLLSLYAVASLIASGYNPFLYFRF